LPIRLAGIDTPEIKGACAREKALAMRARTYVRERLLDAQHIEITPVARDKYFRVLSIITVDGHDLADDLQAAGLARPYGGGTKSPWCTAVLTPIQPD
jgi:endonuclease YncB( thermonuclease family)